MPNEIITSARFQARPVNITKKLLIRFHFQNAWDNDNVTYLGMSTSPAIHNKHFKNVLFRNYVTNLNF